MLCSVNEVIQKIVSQESTTENLIAVTRENQGKIEALNQLRKQIKTHCEDIKYSGNFIILYVFPHIFTHFYTYFPIFLHIFPHNTLMFLFLFVYYASYMQVSLIYTFLRINTLIYFILKHTVFCLFVN